MTAFSPLDRPTKTLRLPAIQTLDDGSTQLRPAHSHIEISVSDAFCDLWEKPNAQTPKQLCQTVKLLCQTLCQFIVICQGNVTHANKQGPLDLVTEADIGIELLFHDWIKRHFPTHKIIGEEGIKDTIEAQDTVWYIDPIDGTSNFVEGSPEVAMLVGCISQGNPLFSAIFAPLKNLYAWGDIFTETELRNHKQLLPIPEPMKTPFTLGTEYRGDKPDDEAAFQRLLRKHQASPFSVKSIGLNVLALLEGKNASFYKDQVKLWDIMGPMCILFFSPQHRAFFDMAFYLPSPDKSLRHLPLKPFPESPQLIEKINYAVKTNCRIGMVIITPKTRPEIATSILAEFRT